MPRVLILDVDPETNVIIYYCRENLELGQVKVEELVGVPLRGHFLIYDPTGTDHDNIYYVATATVEPFRQEDYIRLTKGGNLTIKAWVGVSDTPGHLTYSRKVGFADWYGLLDISKYRNTCQEGQVFNMQLKIRDDLHKNKDLWAQPFEVVSCRGAIVDPGKQEEKKQFLKRLEKFENRRSSSRSNSVDSIDSGLPAPVDFDARQNSMGAGRVDQRDQRDSSYHSASREASSGENSPHRGKYDWDNYKVSGNSQSSDYQDARENLEDALKTVSISCPPGLGLERGLEPTTSSMIPQGSQAVPRTFPPNTLGLEPLNVLPISPPPVYQVNFWTSANADSGVPPPPPPVNLGQALIPADHQEEENEDEEDRPQRVPSPPSQEQEEEEKGEEEDEEEVEDEIPMKDEDEEDYGESFGNEPTHSVFDYRPQQLPSPPPQKQEKEEKGEEEDGEDEEEVEEEILMEDDNRPQRRPTPTRQEEDEDEEDYGESFGDDPTQYATFSGSFQASVPMGGSVYNTDHHYSDNSSNLLPISSFSNHIEATRAQIPLRRPAPRAQTESPFQQRQSNQDDQRRGQSTSSAPQVGNSDYQDYKNWKEQRKTNPPAEETRPLHVSPQASAPASPTPASSIQDSGSEGQNSVHRSDSRSPARITYQSAFRSSPQHQNRRNQRQSSSSSGTQQDQRSNPDYYCHDDRDASRSPFRQQNHNGPRRQSSPPRDLQRQRQNHQQEDRYLSSSRQSSPPRSQQQNGHGHSSHHRQQWDDRQNRQGSRSPLRSQQGNQNHGNHRSPSPPRGLQRQNQHESQNQNQWSQQNHSQNSQHWDDRQNRQGSSPQGVQRQDQHQSQYQDQWNQQNHSQNSQQWDDRQNRHVSSPRDFQRQNQQQSQNQNQWSQQNHSQNGQQFDDRQNYSQSPAPPQQRHQHQGNYQESSPPRGFHGQSQHQPFSSSAPHQSQGYHANDRQDYHQPPAPTGGFHGQSQQQQNPNQQNQQWNDQRNHQHQQYQGNGHHHQYQSSSSPAPQQNQGYHANDRQGYSQPPAPSGGFQQNHQQPQQHWNGHQNHGQLSSSSPAPHYNQGYHANDRQDYRQPSAPTGGFQQNQSSPSPAPQHNQYHQNGYPISSSQPLQMKKQWNAPQDQQQSQQYHPEPQNQVRRCPPPYSSNDAVAMLYDRERRRTVVYLLDTKSFAAIYDDNPDFQKIKIGNHFVAFYKRLQRPDKDIINEIVEVRRVLKDQHPLGIHRNGFFEMKLVMRFKECEDFPKWFPGRDMYAVLQTENREFGMFQNNVVDAADGSRGLRSGRDLLKKYQNMGNWWYCACRLQHQLVPRMMLEYNYVGSDEDWGYAWFITEVVGEVNKVDERERRERDRE